MKPESRHALMELVSYGMEELSSEQAAQLLSRIHECPECEGRWVVLEKTMYVLSHTGETEVSVERSQKMWLACVEHAKKKEGALDSASQKDGVMSPSFRSDASLSDASQREGDRRPSSYPIGTGWLQALKNIFAPRYGYVALAGAVCLFVASLLWTPSSHSSAVLNASHQPSLSDRAPIVSASFRNPPFATTGMLNYHSAMGFEPFSDHAAPNLISTSLALPR